MAARIVLALLLGGSLGAVAGVGVRWGCPGPHEAAALSTYAPRATVRVESAWERLRHPRVGGEPSSVR